MKKYSTIYWKCILITGSYLFLNPVAMSGVVCLNNCEQVVYTETDKTLGNGENIVGTSWTSPTTNLPSALIRHTAGPNYNVVEYVNKQIVHREGKFNFIKYDDYLQLAMFTSFDCGDHYVPYSAPSVDKDCSIWHFREGQEIWKGTSKFTVKLRVTKPMINGTYPIDTLIARYWMSSHNWGHDTLLASYYFRGVITVPESCIIQPGEIYEVDLGEIPKSDFINSTVGQKPLGYVSNPYNINIKCSNGVNDNAKISVRLTGNTANNNSNALASSNPNVGIVVTKNTENEVLKPNDINSIIKLNLINGNADFTIKAYPTKLSSTPLSAGPFEASAVLRFDFQ